MELQVTLNKNQIKAMINACDIYYHINTGNMRKIADLPILKESLDDKEFENALIYVEPYITMKKHGEYLSSDEVSEDAKACLQLKEKLQQLLTFNET